MRILDAQATARALPYTALVPALALAARQMASGEICAPERQVVPLGGDGVLLGMPAIGADIGVTKQITVHGGNAAHGLPAIQGEVIVFERATGRRLALLDGPTVTQRRTAGVTLLGIAQLRPTPPTSAVLIGTGAQAGAHADALVEFFGLRRFWIAARNPARAQAFCAALMQRHPGVAAEPIPMAELPARCQQTDLVIALTTAREPVVPAELPPQTLAIGVGAFKPEMAELPVALLRARPVVVDHLEGARHEAGDLMRADLDWSAVRDLASVLAHGAPSGALPVLKTVGHATWDLAAARVVLGSVLESL